MAREYARTQLFPASANQSRVFSRSDCRSRFRARWAKSRVQNSYAAVDSRDAIILRIVLDTAKSVRLNFTGNLVRVDFCHQFLLWYWANPAQVRPAAESWPQKKMSRKHAHRRRRSIGHVVNSHGSFFESRVVWVNMKQIAYLTMDSLENFVAYDHLTIEPLRRRACHVQHVSWRAQNVAWDDFDLVVIRSPWDYQQDPEQFLGVLQTIEASQATLLNSLTTVKWNIDKRYLQQLQQAGVAIVPTEWLVKLTEADIQSMIDQNPDGQCVCKPQIGAGAELTWWLSATGSETEKSAALQAFANKPLMLQPFIRSVIEVGEYSLFYFGGLYSHCVFKTPKTGDFRVQEEHGGLLKSITPESDLMAAADRAIAAIPEWTLYARVDLVRLDDGTPVVIELELIEPSLYFPFDEASPDRFADAIADYLKRS